MGGKSHKYTCGYAFQVKSSFIFQSCCPKAINNIDAERLHRAICAPPLTFSYVHVIFVMMPPDHYNSQCQSTQISLCFMLSTPPPPTFTIEAASSSISPEPLSYFPTTLPTSINPCKNLNVHVYFFYCCSVFISLLRGPEHYQ